MIRTYEDTFSGARIYPGRGKIFVRIDSKIFRFQCGKTESLFLQRKNPRRIAWTVLYRRARRKGVTEETAKKRTRRAVKSQRAIVGASLDVIKEKRSVQSKTATRKATTLEVKDKKAAEAKKKADKVRRVGGAAGTRQGISSKQGSKGAATKPAPRTR